jgi:hypothetical protein
MSTSSYEDEPEGQPSGAGEPSQAGSGYGSAETSVGGADAVPETPDNVPADGAE